MSRTVAGAQRPSLLALGLAMFRLGLVSFGGNNALLMARMVVERHGWLDDQTMEEAIALATMSPGGNSSNLSYAVGRQIRGVPGGLTSYLAMAAPGVLLALLALALLIQRNADGHWVQGFLSGAEAAAVAMVAAVGLRLGRRCLHTPVMWGAAAVLFIAVGVLRLPLALCVPPVVAVGYYVQRGRERSGAGGAP